MSLEIVDLIIERTNEEIRKNSPDIESERYKPMDADEFRALIGLLLYRGLHRDVKNPNQELWGHQRHNDQCIEQ